MCVHAQLELESKARRIQNLELQVWSCTRMRTCTHGHGCERVYEHECLSINQCTSGPARAPGIYNINYIGACVDIDLDFRAASACACMRAAPPTKRPTRSRQSRGRTASGQETGTMLVGSRTTMHVS